MLRAPRVLLRGSGLFVAAILSLAHFGVLYLRRGGQVPLAERARWLHRWCRRGLRILGLSLDTSGPLPRSGMLVSNHLSYLDILAYSAAVPAVFVAKVEVKSWPLFGWLARLGGTIFIDRRRLRELPGVLARSEGTLREGALLVVFPEATTTDGTGVLPFKPALFEAAVRARAPVVPAHIEYFVGEQPSDKFCWWGEMEFLPHLLRVLASKSGAAEVCFCAYMPQLEMRKPAASAARERVLQLRAPASRRQRHPMGGQLPALQPE